MYTASAIGTPIATEGATFEELQENIRDAVSLYFEHEDPVSLGFDRIPSILINLEVS
jgi:predicted RNase H-like HicB family nuclease